MITILLFAHLQESVGKDRIEFPIEQLTVKELKTALQQDYPLLELDHVMTAVNEEYARNESKVTAGDIVAFIPPVSGG
ncbi:molybdopterin converting factor subunit 1 [Oceanobacillus sp. 143]|uniref:Molybdopterin synthase sulfur carrier subunit n=1 Tax=Oceanobacillus zhaokaii TaxID=2052660 RepID=A0A345PK42_9BACI|nr:molybdopterin converting factor subunit 1 [Oceanobacillus zhaokaii]AXI10372.1 molybdopterin converting factor subunit 1 [Oceanobacillus zhaokaii]QGS69952.1 molybdopterin converting factor subunit 1 [Oceanobacillus sp. 143]